MTQDDIYQPHIQRVLSTLADLEKTSFDRRWLTGAMGFSGATASAVIYRMVRDGLVAEQKETSRYYRPVKPRSGRSTVANQTRVTFVVKVENHE